MTQDMHVYGFKKRATSKMNRSTHTLSILLEQLRSSLGAGKEQVRSRPEYGKEQIFSHIQFYKTQKSPPLKDDGPEPNVFTTE